MAPNPEKGGASLDERQRVLIHACSLNRSDIIKKVISTSPRGDSSSRDGDIDRKVLDHVNEEGLTALHHAVKKSSLDVSFHADDLFHLYKELRVCLPLHNDGGGVVSYAVLSCSAQPSARE